jgi:L-malate glycosyltransferase
MAIKVHFHSDCPFFAGCEKMLVNFWTSDVLRENCKVSFSYRESPEYSAGLDAHFTPDFPVFPLSFPSDEWPIIHLGGKSDLVTGMFRFATRSVLRLFSFIYEIWVIFRLIRKIKPDIVHLNNGGYPAACSVRAAAIGARIAGCKAIVMVVNNLAVPYRTLDRVLDYLFDRLVVRSVTMFVTGSTSAAERLASVLRLESSHVQSLHNGIRLREIKETREQTSLRLDLPKSFSGLVFGVVSLMIERKGHRILIEALEILKRQDPHLGSKLVILFEGEGELRDSLVHLVKLNNLSDVVRFTGIEKNVVDLINAIDVLVLPSVDFEDFPNVTLEAMALGKAVIASRLAGTPEQVIHGETGYLVEPRSADELASAILGFINDRGLAKRMGEDGLKRFQQHFTVDLAVDRYLNLYHSLLS